MIMVMQPIRLQTMSSSHAVQDTHAAAHVPCRTLARTSTQAPTRLLEAVSSDLLADLGRVQRQMQMKQARGMTYYEAALQVLRSAQRPLTTREITRQAIEGRLITPGGKTPHLTMGNVLYSGLRHDPELVKLEVPGNNNRAKHGSVRWLLRHVRSTCSPSG